MSTRHLSENNLSFLDGAERLNVFDFHGRNSGGIAVKHDQIRQSPRFENAARILVEITVGCAARYPTRK